MKKGKSRKERKRSLNYHSKCMQTKERNKVIVGLLINQGIITAEVGRILVEDLDLNISENDFENNKIQ